MNYDLLIIGSHSRHNLGSRLLGGIAEHLLRNAARPVLVIK
jgi:nucleotide-binding universal stress UspA family protein